MENPRRNGWFQEWGREENKGMGQEEPARSCNVRKEANAQNLMACQKNKGPSLKELPMAKPRIKWTN